MRRHSCPACNEKKGRTHHAQEHMFGLGGQFHYVECSGCGSLRLIDPPEDLGTYYPPEYYTRQPTIGEKDLPPFIAGMDLSISAKAQVDLGKARTKAARESILEACTHSALRFYLGDGFPLDARLLDVGAGAGDFVYWLRRIGFANALGVDPFVSTDTPLVQAGVLEDMPTGWDAIVFNHSLEHIADPVATLSAAASKLACEGVCLIRIPLADSYAWHRYGVKWVQLDAPRHVFIPSTQGMEMLTAKAGFTIANTIYDSGLFQFYGSEAYCDGRPLTQEGGIQLNAIHDIADLTNFAAILNATQAGDQASFLLQCKKESGEGV